MHSSFYDNGTSVAEAPDPVRLALLSQESTSLEVPQPAKTACFRSASRRLGPVLHHIIRNRSALSRDRAYAALILAIYGPTPFGGANTAKEVALRYGMTEQNLHGLVNRMLLLLTDLFEVSPAVIPLRFVAASVSPDGSGFPTEEPAVELDAISVELRRACWRDATSRLTPALLLVVQQPTLKGRDRSLAALMVMLYGAGAVLGATSIHEVAIRFGISDRQMTERIDEFRAILNA